MFLKSTTIRHFKSLDNVQVDFSPITVLVGPNGVGKSNFVDALKFFRDICQDGLDHAVISREGIDRIRQTYKSRPYHIGLQMDFAAPETGALPAAYQLVLSGKEGDYRVESETATYSDEEFLQDEDEERNVSFRVEAVPRRYERKRSGQLEIDGKVVDRKLGEDAVALGQHYEFGVLGGSIARYAKKWRFCSLYPNTLRKLSPPIRERGLTEDGGNWASVVRALKRTKSGRAALERIAEVMRVTVPGYIDITVGAAGSYLVPRMSMSGVADGKSKEQRFDPVQLSDGTLRVFGILLALYQQPSPALLVIEEPEQTVHPGVLPALAEAFKEASERTQIVITTHSPHLVDQFQPESIRVVWTKNGLSRISTIRTTQIEAVKRNLMSLEEFMLAEGLQPERDPA